MSRTTGSTDGDAAIEPGDAAASEIAAAPGTKELPQLTRKDFVSDQEVRWCPGCGDYAILSAVQAVFPELGIKRENFVVISGIGCSKTNA